MFSLALAGCQSNSTLTRLNEPDVAVTNHAEISDVSVTIQAEVSTEESEFVYSPLLGAYDFAKSDQGTATLHGILFVTDINLAQPDPNDAVFLVPLIDDSVTTIPPITVGEVPQAEVDERTGEFVFTNIEPGFYVVVVLLKTGVQLPSFTMEEGKLATVKVTEADLDQTIELNYLRIP